MRWFIFFFTTTLFAQTATERIASVSIHGNRIVNDKTLLSLLYHKPGSVFDHEQSRNDAMRILEYYRDRGYLASSIDSIQQKSAEGTDGIRLIFFLSEEKQAKFGSVRISDESDISASQITEVMRWKKGDMFSPGQWTASVNRMLDWFENNGAPFVHIALDSVWMRRDAKSDFIIDILLHIKRRIVKPVGEFIVRGNESTKPLTLTREMRMKLPRGYDHRAIQDGLTRIRRFPFIRSAELTSVTMRPDSLLTVWLDVEEDRANTMDGIIGYVPRDAARDEKGYFTGLIHVSFYNLFGTARQLSMHWQKKNRLSQDLMVQYTEPWLVGWPVNGRIAVQQQIEDSLYSRSAWEMELQTEITRDWSVLAGVRLQSVEPADPKTAFIFNTPQSDGYAWNGGLTGDMRDEQINPRNGLYYHTVFSYGRTREKNWTLSSDGTDTITYGGEQKIIRSFSQSIRTQTWRMDLEIYREPVHRWVIANGLHFSVFRPGRDVAPLSEQFLFGGLKTLRGYTEGFFSGTRVGWNNLELRYVTGRASRLFVFYDQGYYYRRAYADLERTKINKQDGFPWGYGFGMRFGTRLGQFALDYGLGQNDRPSDGKIHFGFTGTF
ncbi:MAG TPA: POTRA domain-containing protein [bacterium]|nr:POTRA domain-containing protein [bacterium]HMY35765.1 POTRA domain-containing protein [bacterium]HNB08293.1 POTRA domain-containing protein [bacterium]HND76734.1 POTRA domain-containing protein [bacterium]HNH29948.1 POTRA domain-containing protein [bacterium]